MGEYLDDSQLTRGRDMGCTAGADIISFDSNKPDICKCIKLASVFGMFCFFFCGKAYSYRDVLKYRLICHPFDVTDILSGKGPVHIKGYAFLRHMESHILIPEAPVDQSAQKMLRPMILHPGKSLTGIDLTGYPLIDG